MSTVTVFGPARSTSRTPAGVSSRTASRPLASISSQPTQRAALPHCSTAPPSAFQIRMKASAFGEGSMAISWSQPIPLSRSAIARASASLGANGCERASTTTKSLPSPFIFRNGRLMGGAYSALALDSHPAAEA